MLIAEHRRPLAAFVLVFAAACLIMGQGLRTHVVDVLVSSGAPRQLIAAIAPDMVLGQALERKPSVRAQVPARPPQVPTTSVRTSEQVVVARTESSPQPVRVATTGNRPHRSTKPSGYKPLHTQATKPASATPTSSPGAAVPAAVPAPVVPAVSTPKPVRATTNPVRGFSSHGNHSSTPTDSTSRSHSRSHQGWSGHHDRSHVETATREDRGHHVRASGNGDGHGDHSGNGRGGDHSGNGRGGNDHHGHHGH